MTKIQMLDDMKRAGFITKSNYIGCVYPNRVSKTDVHKLYMAYISTVGCGVIMGEKLVFDPFVGRCKTYAKRWEKVAK